MLVQDRNIRIVNATTGEILRELTHDPTRTFHGEHRTPTRTTKSMSRTHNMWVRPHSDVCEITLACLTCDALVALLMGPYRWADL